MKPRYYFRKVKYWLYLKQHAEWKKRWNKLKNKDCVIACFKRDNLKFIIVEDNGRMICFAKDMHTNHLYFNDRVNDIRFHLSNFDKMIFKDEDKLLVMDI